MVAYRLYHLDGAGKVASAEWIESADDESAIAAAQATCGPSPCELWLGQRLVARLSPGGATSVDPR